MSIIDKVYYNLIRLHYDINNLIYNSSLKTKDNIIEKFILDFKNNVILNEYSDEYEVINIKINNYIIEYVKTLNYKDKSKINSNNDILETYKIHYEWLESALCNDDPIDIWLCLLLYTIIINNITYKDELIDNLKNISSFKILYHNVLIKLYEITYID